MVYAEGLAWTGGGCFFCCRLIEPKKTQHIRFKFIIEGDVLLGITGNDSLDQLLKADNVIVIGSCVIINLGGELNFDAQLALGFAHDIGKVKLALESDFAVARLFYSSPE